MSDSRRQADRVAPAARHRRDIPGMIERRRNPALAPVAIIIGAILAGALYACYAGGDINWVWQNYHDYNVWALIHGRYAIDVMPAGLQTYFNPLVYFLAYGLRHALPPLYGGLLM